MDVLGETKRNRTAKVTTHRAVVEVAGRIHAEAGPDPDGVLSALTEAAVAHLPGADHAGVSIVTNRTIRSVGCTDGVPRLIGEIQGRLGEGPCFDSSTTGTALRADDLATESRWPTFCDVAVRQTPIRSILTMPLFRDGPTVGALTFYADRPGVYGDEIEGLALTFAAQAALIVQNRRRESYFRTALANRDIIGQAKGVLSERFTIDSATAFALLIRLAKERHEPVAAVARRIVRHEPNLLH